MVVRFKKAVYAEFPETAGFTLLLKIMKEYFWCLKRINFHLFRTLTCFKGVMETGPSIPDGRAGQAEASKRPSFLF